MAGRSRKSGEEWKKLVEAAPEKSCSYMGRFFGRMEDQVEHSARDGLEHGVTFCLEKESGKVFATDPCTGDKCSLRPVRCEVGEELYGDFHVHPTGRTEQSMSDISYMLAHGQRVGCVGGTVKAEYWSKGKGFKVPTTKIKCYAFDIDSKAFPAFKKSLRPKLREAARLSSALVDKQFREKEAISKSEWKEYKKAEDGVESELKASGLYYDRCPIITESFGETERYRIEESKPIRRR